MKKKPNTGHGRWMLCSQAVPCFPAAVQCSVFLLQLHAIVCWAHDSLIDGLQWAIRFQLFPSHGRYWIPPQHLREGMNSYIWITLLFHIIIY
jgi:hypothetical protein